MTESAADDSFEKIVDWAYSTLPEKIRNLPDFPGIQVADEPPEEMFQKMSKSRNWPQGTELFGCYSGVCRTKRQFNLVQTAPDLIFVFRGLILRSSKGNLRAEVKRVVWHEVAHWLGHDEVEVKELGLSRSAEGVANQAMEGEAWKPVLLRQFQEATDDEAGNANEQHLRCLKCYSPEVTYREGDQPITSYGAWLSDPLSVHPKIWTCKSCGYEWDDDDNA